MMAPSVLQVALIICAAFATINAYRSYEGHSVLRITPQNEQQLRYIEKYLNDPKVMFWAYTSIPGRPCDMMVASGHVSRVTQDLTAQGIPWKKFVENVQRLIDEEKRSNALAKLRSGRAFSLSMYHSHTEVNDWMKDLASTHQHCSYEDIGTSHEGRTMRIIKIGTSTNAPAIWIDCGIHAREWLSPATCVYMINQLAEKYSTDTEIKDLVDRVNWYILPMHNPDGYEYSRQSDRMWRKTRRPTGYSSFWWGKCFGTDPNRNWDFHWNEVGASSDGCSDIYAGPNPFSDSETKAVSDYVMNKKSIFKSFLTFHTYSQLWMTPWGYTSSVPNDYSDLVSLATSAVSALTKVHGTKYGKVESSTNALYAAAGGSDDWAKGVAGIKYSYTIELRDTGRYGFIAPSTEIIPTGEETWAGVKVVGKHVAAGLP